MAEIVRPIPQLTVKPIFAPEASPSSRIWSVDVLRGLVMVVMALDHTRDYLTYLRFQPEDLTRSYPALFFTRWITHFCAPLFFFLAGTGAYLLRSKSGTTGKVAKFLWTRGLWLIVLEFTVIEYAWTFVPWYFGGVIWSLGCAMITLGVLVWLPEWAILVLGLLVVGAHDLTDGIKLQTLGAFAPIWSLLHRTGTVPLTQFFVLFPILPWAAVMALGYVFGRVLLRSREERQRFTLRLGLLATLLFVCLRAFNAYGNPSADIAFNSAGAWHPQGSWAMTVVAFLDVEKYPASLQFLLMTLGPSLILLSYLDRVQSGSIIEKILHPLLIFGRVPLFFYVLHLYLIHVLAVILALAFHQPVQWLLHGAFWMNRLPAGYGHGLPMIYAMWVLAAVILYFPCAWFAGLKQRRRSSWLSYL
ncbi:MAG TPA: heparan-alpha-glucosaminide N-acetyltransferase domain-containing protein [Terriglobales bacterium]|nr:heparan-alpha-glucosaminide N-acetyltransferase domain-containing protein [Terriglobales bacterium]